MKRMSLISLIIILSMLVLSCNMLPSIRESREETTKINPLPEAANKVDREVTLYFRYSNENMLAGETRIIDVPVNERIEMTVLKEIFNGPSQNSQELFSVIPENASFECIVRPAHYGATPGFWVSPAMALIRYTMAAPGRHAGWGCSQP